MHQQDSIGNSPISTAAAALLTEDEPKETSSRAPKYRAALPGNDLARGSRRSGAGSNRDRDEWPVLSRWTRDNE